MFKPDNKYIFKVLLREKKLHHFGTAGTAGCSYGFGGVDNLNTESIL
jgi:hypothetical protein